MGVETELTELRNRPDGNSFRVVEGADGVVTVYTNDNPVVTAETNPVTGGIIFSAGRGDGYVIGENAEVIVDAPMSEDAASAVDISAHLQMAADYAASVGARKIVLKAGYAKVLSTVYLREACRIYDSAYAALSPAEYMAVGVSGDGIGITVLIGGNNTMFVSAPTGGTSRTLISPIIEDMSLIGPADLPVVIVSAGCTNGSVTVTVADTTSLEVGMWLFEYGSSGWSTGTRIESIAPNTSITVRNNFTGTTNSYTLAAYKDSCAVQFGGHAVDRTNTIGLGVVKKCYVNGFFTGLRLDDCTETAVDQCYFAGNEYDVEGWFNINGFRTPGSMFKGVGFCTAASSTFNATTAITGVAPLNGSVPDIRMLIRPGSNISEYTTFGIPADARVLAFPSSNSLTLSAAATVSGEKSIAFFKGTLLALASGPWRPGYNTGVGAPSSIDFSGALIGQKSFVIEAQGAAGTKAVEANGIYLEKVMCFAKLADQSTINLRSVYVSLAQYMTGAAFINLVGAGGIANRVTLDGIDFSGSLPVNVIKTVSSAAKGSMRLDYKNVAVTMNGSVGQIQCGGGLSLNPTSGSRFTFNLGPNQSGCVYAGGNSTASVNLEVGGLAAASYTLNASTVTFNAPTVNGAQSGQTLEMLLTQDATGGRTPVWNAAWKGATLTVSGTANQKAIVTYKFDGASFVQVSSTGWYS